MGDMTAETGIAHECIKYARNHQLPIRFIVEDNGKSVCTDTREAWNQPVLTLRAAPHPTGAALQLPDEVSPRRGRPRVQF